MKKFLRFVLIFFVVVAIVYAFGPKVPTPELALKKVELPNSIEKLDDWVAAREASFEPIKPDNQSQILWADSSHVQTEYAVVYLHGFSASTGEGNNLHRDFACRYGANLYLPRLQAHGLERDLPMEEFTADGFLQSAQEAVSVGKMLGKKVIVLACSTGCTAALYLASQSQDIDAMFLFSPNVALDNGAAFLLSKPWGHQILKVLEGGETHRISDAMPKEAYAYWYEQYNNKSVPQLQALIESTMVEEVFGAIEIPVFTGLFYKDETTYDKVISIPSAEKMMAQIRTPKDQKRTQKFANVGNHCMISELVSQDMKGVEEASFLFAEEVLGLEKVGK